jgi:hypothetical protein
MELEIDPTRFRLVPDTGYAREVYYGGLFILVQHFSDPTCAWEQQRALDSAASLLRHRWERVSAHQRLQLLAAIEGRLSGRDSSGSRCVERRGSE